MREFLENMWRFANKNLISGVLTAGLSVYLSHRFTKEYREEEIDQLKSDRDDNLESIKRLRRNVDELQLVNTRVVSELSLIVNREASAQNKHRKCVSTLRNSWCFFRRPNINDPINKDSTLKKNPPSNS